MRELPPPQRGGLGIASFGVIALVTTVIAFTVTIGADAQWLVALGNVVASTGTVPKGVPFAAADTNAWVNVPVLGELLLALIDRLGPWGLISAQVIAVALTTALLARTAKRLGASDSAAAMGVLLFSIGGLAALGVVRVQLFSLPLFAALLLLLRTEQKRRSRRVWLLVPLIALWGNLHGAVLVGVAITGSYLLLARFRHEPKMTAVLLIVMLSTVWWTPALLPSHRYYLDVLTNEAAKRHEGLWATISFDAPLDVLLVLAGVVLLALALRRRLPLWEYVAITGLFVMTVQAARHGVWLLAFLVPRAALTLSRPYAAERGDVPRRASSSGWRGCVIGSLALAGVLVACVLGVSQQARGVEETRRVAAEITHVIGPARPTLAPSPLAESLAAAGLTLYGGNPLDAFPAARQRAYLDFLRDPDSSVSLRPLPRAVVVADDVETPGLRAHFAQVRHVDHYRVYLSGSIVGTHRA